jgi:hypothetical protein
VHGVDFTMALREHGVPDHANARMEEQPPRMAQSFPWQFPGKAEPFFFGQDGRALNCDASRKQHKVSWPLAFLSDQLGFAYLAEHLTYHNWTSEPTGNFCVTAAEGHTQRLAGPKRVPKDIPRHRQGRASFREQ